MKMFSQNMDEIQALIDQNTRYNKSEIDPKVIRHTNLHIDDPEFVNYVLRLPHIEQMMVIKYQNIIEPDRDVTRILEKLPSRVTEEDALNLMCWIGFNHAGYIDLNLDPDSY